MRRSRRRPGCSCATRLEDLTEADLRAELWERADARQGLDGARNTPPAPRGGACRSGRGAASGARLHRRGPAGARSGRRDSPGARSPRGRRGPRGGSRCPGRPLPPREELAAAVVERWATGRASAFAPVSRSSRRPVPGAAAGLANHAARPDQWIAGRREVTDEREALREVCRRFIHAYGPTRPDRLPRVVLRSTAHGGRRASAVRRARRRAGGDRRRWPAPFRPRRRHRVPGAGEPGAAAAGVRRLRDGVPRARPARAGRCARADREARPRPLRGTRRRAAGPGRRDRRGALGAPQARSADRAGRPARPPSREEAPRRARARSRAFRRLPRARAATADRDRAETRPAGPATRESVRARRTSSAPWRRRGPRASSAAA